MGAELYDANVPSPDPAMFLPEPSILLQPGDLLGRSHFIAKASNQRRLTVWITEDNPALYTFKAVLETSPQDKARVAHLQQVLLKGPDVRLTLDPDKVT